MRILPSVICLALAIAPAIGHTEETPASPASSDAGTNASLLDRVKGLLALHKDGEALAILSSYHPAPEEESAYNEYLGQALDATGSRMDALERYRIATLYASRPEDKERLLMKRAEIYGQMGYYAEAAVCLEAVLKAFPNSPSKEQIHLKLADCRTRLNQPAEALRHYEQAGTSSQAIFGKAYSLQTLGRQQEAHDLYLALIEKDRAYVTQSPQALLAVGENFRLMGKSADAAIYLSSIQDPALQPAAELQMGLIELQGGKTENAIKRFDDALKSDDRSVKRRALLGQAEAFRKTGRVDAAMTALLEIKSSYPYGKEYDQALLLLSRIYRSRGERSRCIPLLKELVFRRQPDAGALDELDALMHDALAKDRKEFTKLWTEAGQWLLDPSKTDSLILFAEGLQGSGKPFLDLCHWILKQGPDSAKIRTRLLLAGFYAGIGDGVSAMNYLQRVKDRSRTVDDAYERIAAKVFLLNNDREKTAQSIMAMKEPADAEIMLLLQVVPSLKKPAEALDFCDRILQKRQASAATYAAFADTLFDAGRTADARRYYEAAASQTSPTGTDDAAWARYRLARLEPDTVSTLPTATAGTEEPSPYGRVMEADVKATEVSRKTKKVL